ncbi:MAG: hypothetical protein JTT11_03255 [Candidatus Brockarchaeota archaeon]|nr:hypothetical protein [Candidatus Brockarchaeota archaeon]
MDKDEAIEVSKRSREVRRLLDRHPEAAATYARELSPEDVQRIMREHPDYLPTMEPKALWSVHWSLPGVGVPERPMVLVYLDAGTGEIVGVKTRWLEKNGKGIV